MFLPTKILWMLTTFQILCLHLKYQQELPHCCLSPTQKFSCFQPSKTLFFLCMNVSTCRKETIQSYNLFSSQKAFDWWSICRYWLIYFQHFYTKWGVRLHWNKNCLHSVVCGELCCIHTKQELSNQHQWENNSGILLATKHPKLHSYRYPLHGWYTLWCFHHIFLAIFMKNYVHT